MSIHAISGKPGGGKTLYSIRLIVNELVYGTRPVITNVALKLDELNAYLQREYPKKSVDLFSRVILIDEDRMARFFTIRPVGSQGPTLLTKEEWAAGKIPDYSGVTDSGVLYVLDEVHIKFNARAWMLTGQDVLYYLSQHRKLGDDVVWITQAVGNVDKQFRSVTQDYTFIRNLGKERMSHFHLPSLFVRQTYNEPPSGNATPMETGSFRMDVSGLASLYDTAAGVGIHGTTGADTGEKKKGVPWWVGLAICLLIIVIGFATVPKLIASVFRRPYAAAKQTIHSPMPAAVVRGSVDPGQQSTTKTNEIVVQAQSSTNEVRVCGYHHLTGKWVIMLSDGNELREGDEDLKEINRTKGVLYRGKWIPFARPAVGVGAPASYTPDYNAEMGPPTRYRVIGPSGKTSVVTP